MDKTKPRTPVNKNTRIRMAVKKRIR